MLRTAGPLVPAAALLPHTAKSDDLMNHGAPTCLHFFRLCLLGKKQTKPTVVSVLNGGRGACMCNAVLTFVSLLVAL